jgi:hypothetical protein
MKTIAATALTFALSTGGALAWGDDGHKVVALIADHYLTPSAKKQVGALLAAGTDPLTQHDIASEATWADKYRNKHRETASWHFVDLEITDPDFNAACNGRPALAAGTLASNGPPDCVVDKINQFAIELEARHQAFEQILQLALRQAANRDHLVKNCLGPAVTPDTPKSFRHACSRSVLTSTPIFSLWPRLRQTWPRPAATA